MSDLDDLKMNLLHFPKAPYSCGSAEGWMKKAHDRIEELEGALRLAEDVLSRAPFSNALWPNGMHPQGGIEQIRTALHPKAGA